MLHISTEQHTPGYLGLAWRHIELIALFACTRVMVVQPMADCFILLHLLGCPAIFMVHLSHCGLLQQVRQMLDTLRVMPDGKTPDVEPSSNATGMGSCTLISQSWLRTSMAAVDASILSLFFPKKNLPAQKKCRRERLKPDKQL